MTFPFQLNMEYKAPACIIGFILINLTLGTFYSIGNLTPYIASYMRNNGNPTVTTEHGTWITAAYLFGQGLFILVGAFIEQKCNTRVACILGCAIHCLSTFMTMWAVNQNLLSLILVYGLGSGLGCGPAYVSSIIAAQRWYPQHKGIFTGLMVAGFGFGGLVFTPLQTLYMNPNNTESVGGYFDSSVYDRVPNLFLYMGITFSVTQAIGCALAYPPPPASNSKSVSNKNNQTLVNDDLLPNPTNLSSIFRHKILYIIGCMMMLVAPGVIFMNSLGKRYGQSYIADDRFLATVVALSAVANALGRFTWGFLIEKFNFSSCYTAKVMIFATLIAFFPFGFILGSRILYSIWMLGLFFSFSGIFVLFPVFIEQVFGSHHNGLIYGLLYMLLALSTMITAFMIQMTIAPASNSKEKTEPSLMTRVIPCAAIAYMYVLSYILYLFLIPVRRLEKAIQRRREMETVKARDTLMTRQDLYPLERPSLAEKTTNNALEKENSLGSIVRFREAPQEEKRLKTLGKK